MPESILPTFAQFTAWGFKGDQETFLGLLTPAQAVVDYCIPVPNEVDATDAVQVTAYQKAICATVEYLESQPAQGIKAYTAGKVHEEFTGAESAYATARKYLSGSGLLSMWP